MPAKPTFWERMKSLLRRATQEMEDDLPEEPGPTQVMDTHPDPGQSYVRIGVGNNSVLVCGPLGRVKEILYDHIKARCEGGSSVKVSEASIDMRGWIKDVMKDFPSKPKPQSKP
jgi:hypothetical protein